MTSRQDSRGRPFTSRSLSKAIGDLPGSHTSVSYTAVNNLANGSQDNPTVHTVVALCEALGHVPPAHLLPHSPYSDLEALQAFEDPRARQLLKLLSGLPPEAVDDLISHLVNRRAELGLPPASLQGAPEESEPVVNENPPAASRRASRRRRTSDEAAEYAADSLEGL
ncbi:hypothetical protein [Streptomyces sp. NPDC059783]|uniref:hypothetical protein n=1 Tax=Streptomyces sp. NPDC059783 TaxID=3346944 RepID=UPI0036603576